MSRIIEPFVVGKTYCFRKKEDIGIFHVCGKGKTYIETDFVLRVDSYGILLNSNISKASNPTSFFFSKYVNAAELDDYQQVIRFIFKYGNITNS